MSLLAQTEMTAPRSATARHERIATTATFLGNGLGIGAWAASIPALQQRLALTDGRLSLVLLAFSLGAVATMPVAGRLAPRAGTAWALRLSGAVFATTLLLPFLAGTLAWLIAAALVVGAANGAMDIAMNAHATAVERRRGSPVMSSFHAAFSAGGLLGAALGAALAAFGVAPGWVMGAAAIVCATLIATAWAAVGPGDPPETRGGPGLSLPGRAALPLCLAAVLCMMCEGAVADWSAVYLATVAGAAVSLAATGYAAFSATMLAGRLGGDRIVAAMGGAWVIAAGGALAAAGLALAAAWPVPIAAALGFALVGIGLSNIVPVIFSAAGRLGASPATGIAMVATAGYAGFLGGPPLIGATASAIGLRAGIVVLAVAAAGVALLAAAVEPARAD